MAHVRAHLQTMLAWIEETIAAGEPAPGDGAICDRFGFASPEQARTLLAELADAGKITIRGWGADRAIALGRVRSAPIAAGRPTPAVQRADPVLDAGMAKIAAILARGRPAPSPTVTTEAKPRETKMPGYKDGKYISLPADGALLRRIERYAKDADLAVGTAAAELVCKGLDALAVPAPAPPRETDPVVAAERILVALSEVSTRDLLEELGARLESGVPAIERDVAIARAEAAEGQLATIRQAVLGQANG